MRRLMGLVVLLLWGGTAFAATECAQAGDVVIYRAPDETGQFMISQSATVAAMEGCVLREVHIDLQGEQGAGWCSVARVAGTRLQLDPDAPAIAHALGSAPDWVVLHTDRQPAGNRLSLLREGRVGTARQRLSLYETDKGTLIVGEPVSSGPAGTRANCHGITFTNGEAAIIGWAAEGHWHVDAAVHDQATAVQIILDDNGYRKVHALDRQGVDHF